MEEEEEEEEEEEVATVTQFKNHVKSGCITRVNVNQTNKTQIEFEQGA